MKKAFILVLAIWAAACILGCNSTEAIPTQPAPFEVTCSGVQIHVQDLAAPVIEALGVPMGYTEETSCFFDGLDKTYYYGSFYILTRPDPDGDRIQSLWFADDTVATAEGIAIGANREAVEHTYGADCFQSPDACTLTKGESTLTIILSEGTVTGIRYDAVIS